VDEFARQNKITTRTLQRYFENATGISTKKVLQILRIRKAAAHLATFPANFHFSQYGYYDHSHFFKHLKQFLRKDTILNLQPHIRLLESLHKQ
jgi:transcriptional regulator GlxA family with amidase domain